MAWVKEFDKEPEWVEGKSYTGAIVCGYAWNCPKEKDCQERKAITAFTLNNAPLHKKVKLIIIQSCLYWDRRGHECGKPKRKNQEINIDVPYCGLCPRCRKADFKEVKKEERKDSRYPIFKCGQCGYFEERFE